MTKRRNIWTRKTTLQDQEELPLETDRDALAEPAQALHLAALGSGERRGQGLAHLGRTQVICRIMGQSPLGEQEVKE